MFELFCKVFSSLGYFALQGSTPFLLSQNLSLTSKVVICCQSQLSRLSSVSILTFMQVIPPFKFNLAAAIKLPPDLKGSQETFLLICVQCLFQIILYHAGPEYTKKNHKLQLTSLPERKPIGFFQNSVQDTFLWVFSSSFQNLFCDKKYNTSCLDFQLGSMINIMNFPLVIYFRKSDIYGKRKLGT